jgi:hypothetical protein
MPHQTSITAREDSLHLFRPKSAVTYHKNPEEERNSIRAMFGDLKLDDEAVKYFAKQDFFLADSLADLEEQLRTTLDFLTLLTRKGSIAVEGYEYGLQFIDENRQIFQLVISSKKNFCVRSAFVLDGVFQGFLNQLGQFHGRSNAISKAGRTLRGFQKTAIMQIMAGFAYWSIPDIIMPAGLGEKLGSEGQGKRDKPVAKAKASPQDWWATNPSPETSWAIPDGKSFTNFFSGRDPALKKNLFGWPNVKHHTQGRKKPLCVKYQAIGICLPGCAMAHLPPSQMPAGVRTAALKRFAEIYAS